MASILSRPQFVNHDILHTLNSYWNDPNLWSPYYLQDNQMAGYKAVEAVRIMQARHIH